MAGHSNADTLRDLNVDTSRSPILKDMHGSDNPIPLSPQWLLPKPGDSKLGAVSGEPNLSPHHGKYSDAAKVARNGEPYPDTEKKKDVFRPSFYDIESGRRDRWHDEEREINPGIRRDRWREGDKDIGDSRRPERWADNSSRHSVEARRGSSDKWMDSGNRENNFDQRRESKWNTRWGPDDKDSENKREKWSDSSRDGELSREKGISHLTNQGKDTSNHVKDTDKDGEHHSRSWRSNSFLGRGRGDTSNHPSLSSNKPSPTFGYGRGRGENGVSVFPAGRGRGNPMLSSANTNASRSYSLGAVSDKLEDARGDPYTLKYTRTKLLDIYRMTDISNCRLSFKGFIEVPSLTIGEPLEPLALSAPPPEELGILKGIDKGDIVSSVLPQVSKDGSVGRSPVDVPSKHARPGSREDLPYAVDDHRDDFTDSSKVLRFEGFVKKGDRVRDSSLLESFSTEYHVQPRCQCEEHSSHDCNVTNADAGPGWPNMQKDLEIEQMNNSSVSSAPQRDVSLQHDNKNFHSEFGYSSMVRRQSSEVLGKEMEGSLLHGPGDSFILKDKPVARKLQSQPSPEELTLYYKDPQGRIQGPFSGSDLIGWFEAGYFGIDLPVRIASAPADTPFSLLGDVMPHLRMKSRPPPGFNLGNQNDVVLPNAGNFTIPGNSHRDAAEFEFFKNGQKARHGMANGAENRYFESLMSGKLSSSPSKHASFTEGTREYVGNVSGGGMPSVGGESLSDLNYLLSQQLSLERQKSLPNPLPFWPGRDASSIPPKTDFFPTTPLSNSKSLPLTGDAALHVPQVPQHPDLLSLLQANADKSPSPAVNSGLSVWSNFPDVQPLNSNVHGGIGIVQDKIEMHHNQHFAPQSGFGVQLQRPQTQNQPSLSHLINQLGVPSGIVSSDNLLSSDISHDPQIRALLQQKLLLSQLQLQSQPVLPAQLSPLEIYLLQQQQGQQQQQLLLQQQQQQQQNMLSQVLSGHQSHQPFPEPSYGHLRVAMPTVSAHIDQLGLHQIQEALQIHHQMPVVDVPNDANSPPNLNVQASHDGCCPDSSNPLHLPHQTFDPPTHSKDWDSTPSEGIDTILKPDPITAPAMADGLAPSWVMNKLAEQPFVSCKNVLDVENLVHDEQVALSQTNETVTIVASGDMEFSNRDRGASDLISSVSMKVSDAKNSLVNAPEQCHTEPPSTKGVKNAEMREVKKTSEKKSKKQKNLKVQSVSDHAKGSSKAISSEQPKQDSEIQEANSGITKPLLPANAEEPNYASSPLGIGGDSSVFSTAEPVDSQQARTSSSSVVPIKHAEVTEGRLQQDQVGNLVPNPRTNASHRSWKSAPGLKAKSLLEIQMEEQRKAQMETMPSEPAVAVPTNINPTPWSGGMTNLANQPNRVSVPTASPQTMDLKSRKSQLHDLLAEEVLAKANEADKNFPAGDHKDLALSPPKQLGPLVDVPPNDDDFVEAKETRKSRKKAAKVKNAGLKASSPVASADLSTPAEKVKPIRQVLQEPESLPVPPGGPSLADFVLWRGDQANHAPVSAAWSTESGKVKKPASLREIQKEQEKKALSVQQHIPVPAIPKGQPSLGNRGSGSSWQLSGSSPSKTESSVQSKVSSIMQPISSISAQSKVRAEDDLFWGPLDQSKQETKQSDFPSLASSSSWGVKNSPAKLAPGKPANRQKTGSNRSADYSLSPSLPNGQLKGRKDASTKNSEAMDFRDWCENELFRLTGTKDTSFLEYCLKQSASEAEMLLSANLGSLDRDREFIDKFLNYKEFLSSDVIEIAFQAQSSSKVTVATPGHTITSKATAGDFDAEMEVGIDGSSRGSKKKGKKCKKVSPSVLGFNVVSNRIMMGEIQTVED
ncbi:hypothetical protein J5N97_010172 [Dioscorea zingiberensis]|uniref:GYF domain-containing protein n=1 Tax=Dioscorea zingiberensis TaxID=325984 RepID=A0A9D5HND1_9LILI|nr:hypothetical protein J5N97_010172 [Dioscorea zingiberensis]